MNFKSVLGLVAIAIIAGLVFIFRGRLFGGGGGPPPAPPAGAPTPPPPPTRELYVASMGAHAIVGFSIDANGAVASTPSRIIRGPSTGLQNPFAVALANTNRIWVANLGVVLPGQPPIEPTITVYEADANGDAAPIRTITQQNLGTGFTLQQNLANPTAIAIRTAPENPFVANSDGGSVFEFELAAGNQPSGGFRGALTQPTGVAVDSERCIYIADSSPDGGSVLVFVPTQSGQFEGQLTGAAPDLRITGINNPAHLAIGRDRELFVVVRGTLELAEPNAGVYIYAVGATGNAAPIRVIRGPNTGLTGPYGVAVDGDGRTFVSNGNSVRVFLPGANGNVFPDETVSHFEISNAGGLAVR